MSCLKYRAFQGLSVSTKRMSIQGTLAFVNPILYVVITADSDQTVYFQIRIVFISR